MASRNTETTRDESGSRTTGPLHRNPRALRAISAELNNCRAGRIMAPTIANGKICYIESAGRTSQLLPNSTRKCSVWGVRK